MRSWSKRSGKQASVTCEVLLLMEVTQEGYPHPKPPASPTMVGAVPAVDVLDHPEGLDISWQCKLVPESPLCFINFIYLFPAALRDWRIREVSEPIRFNGPGLIPLQTMGVGH